jgi:hypothetical protein
MTNISASEEALSRAVNLDTIFAPHIWFARKKRALFSPSKLWTRNNASLTRILRSRLTQTLYCAFWNIMKSFIHALFVSVSPACR